jgi:hypothetical protein
MVKYSKKDSQLDACYLNTNARYTKSVLLSQKWMTNTSVYAMCSYIYSLCPIIVETMLKGKDHSTSRNRDINIQKRKKYIDRREMCIEK